MELTAKIYVAGHNGLVGSAIVRQLKKQGFTNLITASRGQLDLTNQLATQNFFNSKKPDYVILAAAKVGGIEANNTYRANFIYENLQIQNNVIHQSYVHNVKKLLFLGSTCVYPKKAPQPMSENCLLSSELEYSNEPYAIAKIAGIKMCENYNLQYGTNFIVVMPTNVYGPRDTFNLATSHVLPALIRKMHVAKINSKSQVEVWGSGKPKREFLYVIDMADACIFILQNINFSDTYKTTTEIRNTHINIGVGKDISIKELAQMIKNIVGFNGKLVFNTDKADGTLRKLTNIEKLTNMGWTYNVELRNGIEKTYNWYLKNCDKLR